LAKHIKLKAELLRPDFKRVKVTVLEQTHFGYAFGPKEQWGGSYFEYAKFKICSSGGAINAYYSTKVNLLNSAQYLPGQVYDRPYYNSCIVSLEKYKRLKKTVEAYNKRFADEP